MNKEKKKGELYIHASSQLKTQSGDSQTAGTLLEVDLDTGQIFVPKERLRKAQAQGTLEEKKEIYSKAPSVI
jgi:hypothetical protein